MGSGGLIRNNYGGGVVDFSYLLGHQMNHFSKASAARQIVKLTLAFGIENLWLEGDSLNIINYLNSLTTPSWTIANIIKEVKSDLGKFSKTYISHVYREANLAAD